MPSVRQDAWTKDEDLFLAEVVLRHIREGSTQLKAFEEVGKALSRTAAACGFRWNSTVRKQYKAAIELAKKQRKELKKKQHSPSFSHGLSGEKSTASEAATRAGKNLTLQDVIAFLQEYQLREQERSRNLPTRQEQEALAKKIAKLEEENQLFKKKYQTLQEEYFGLLAIMDKARKLSEQSGAREEQSTTVQKQNGEDTQV